MNTDKEKGEGRKCWRGGGGIRIRWRGEHYDIKLITETTKADFDCLGKKVEDVDRMFFSGMYAFMRLLREKLNFS